MTFEDFWHRFQHKITFTDKIRYSQIFVYILWCSLCGISSIFTITAGLNSMQTIQSDTYPAGVLSQSITIREPNITLKRSIAIRFSMSLQKRPRQNVSYLFNKEITNITETSTSFCSHTQYGIHTLIHPDRWTPLIDCRDFGCRNWYQLEITKKFALFQCFYFRDVSMFEPLRRLVLLNVWRWVGEYKQKKTKRYFEWETFSWTIVRKYVQGWMWKSLIWLNLVSCGCA